MFITPLGLPVVPPVGEIATTNVVSTLNDAARAEGFTPHKAVVEIAGQCAHCRAREGIA